MAITEQLTKKDFQSDQISDGALVVVIMLF